MTKERNVSQSLIPYLDPDNSKFYLKISLSSGDTAIVEKSISPFMTITESGPLARIIEAQFSTNAGSEIKRVFLLLQKDEYRFAKDDLRPVYNKDIDQWWQEAFSFHKDKDQDGSMILLLDQISEEGGMLPFQSLFFCKHRQIFFHPLCPECGSALQQCYDDDVLKGVGLQPYSTSTRRYLFCPSCFDSEGRSNFHAVSLESTDPPILKDRLDLIRDFGKIAEDWEHPGQFPCMGCPTRLECYGAEGLAGSRIVPFSFYPFYMLIFDAMALNAVDFLSLVSGASFEELETRLAEKQETGRMNCLRILRQKHPAMTPFFFDNDERYFLEVLYLKLSFLGELIQTIFLELDHFKYPDFGISIDRIWIKLPDQGGQLPFFWDFKIKLMDVVGSTAGSVSFPKAPPSYGLYFLGLVWVYTLLTNKKQDVSEVYGVIGQALEEKTSIADMDLDNILKIGADSVFSPENIFWDPETGNEKPVHEFWKHFWQESLGLGWSLLKAGLKGDTEWPKDEFLRDLMNLRENVKDNLFRFTAPVVQTDPAQESRAIHNILAGIMKKWTMDLEAKKDVADDAVASAPSSDRIPGPSEGILQEEGTEQQTVILPSDNLEKEAAPPVQEDEELDKTVALAPPSDDIPVPSGGASRDDEDVQQTVILRTQDFAKESDSPVQEKDRLDKTKVLSPTSGGVPGPFEGVLEDDKDVGYTAAISSDVPGEEPAVREEDVLDETVILSPGDYSKQTPTPDRETEELDATVIISPQGPDKKEPPSAGTQEDDVPATVVIKPSESEKAGFQAGPASQPQPEADELDETVILRPGKDRRNDR